MERPVSGLTAIGADEYQQHFKGMRHLFLVGNLQQPNPHPFFHDPRLEVIACEYQAGDNGLFHWHATITEYELILEGSVSYVEAATGQTTRFYKGDFTTVPAGICVARLVDEPCRTLAIKVPSNSEKVHCSHCDRQCESRVERYEP